MKEKQYLRRLLKEKLPIRDGITILTSYLSTIQNYVSEALTTFDNEPLDDWVEVEDMDGKWDMMPEAERMMERQRRMETRKTKNQIIRELAEKANKRQLEAQGNFLEGEQSIFIGQSKAIDDLRPLFEEQDTTVPEWYQSHNVCIIRAMELVEGYNTIEFLKSLQK